MTVERTVRRRKRFRRKGALGVSLALAASFALVGCGSSSPGASTSAGGSQAGGGSAPFRVLFLGPLSGPIGSYGAEFVTGIRAAVTVLNKSGGVAGHKVVVSTADDQANPTLGLTLLSQKLSGSSKPSLLLTLTSQEGDAYGPAAAKSSVIEQSACDKFGAQPFVFCGDVPYSIPWKQLAGFTKGKGWKTVYLLGNDDAAGLSALSYMRKAAAQFGIKVLGQSTFEDTAISVVPQIEAADASHADAIWETDQGQTPVVFKSRLKAGGTSVPWVCDTACGTGVAAPADGIAAVRNAWGLAYPLQVTPAPKRSSAQREFVSASRAEGTPFNLVTSATQYDFLLLLATAAKQAKSDDTTALANALVHLTPGPETTFAFGSPLHYVASAHQPYQLSDKKPPYVVTKLSDLGH